MALEKGNELEVLVAWIDHAHRVVVYSFDRNHDFKDQKLQLVQFTALLFKDHLLVCG
jgi:hypothetical protein